jgi:hypothetical protein
LHTSGKYRWLNTISKQVFPLPPSPTTTCKDKRAQHPGSWGVYQLFDEIYEQISKRREGSTWILTQRLLVDFCRHLVCVEDGDVSFEIMYANQNK